MSSLPVACVAIQLPPAVQAALSEVADLRFLDPNSGAEQIRGTLADGEALLCSALFPLPAEILAMAPRLRVVANFGVGYNNVDLAEAARRGIAVCNTPDVLSAAVADLTLALILAASRRIIENYDYVRRGEWASRQPAPPLGFDLAGKTLGIVGFGRIGREVAVRARAFGMHVSYFDVAGDAGDEWSWCQRESLHDLLSESDIVSVHVNLTPLSHHLIGAIELGLMKPSAWLVNTSRGPAVDQAALVSALKTGQIAGAALDVLETEPPDANDPILSLPNVIALPHVGSATVETRAAMLDLAVRNLRAVLAGERPPACVNPEVLG